MPKRPVLKPADSASPRREPIPCSSALRDRTDADDGPLRNATRAISRKATAVARIPVRRNRIRVSKTLPAAASVRMSAGVVST